MTANELRRMFDEPAPDAGQQADLTEVREAARRFVETLTGVCPPCADTSAAIRRAREAYWAARASILREASIP